MMGEGGVFGVFLVSDFSFLGWVVPGFFLGGGGGWWGFLLEFFGGFCLGFCGWV